MIFYSDKEAEQVADDFFKYHYVDSGKMKWQGFILSEQTAALKNTSIKVGKLSLAVFVMSKQSMIKHNTNKQRIDIPSKAISNRKGPGISLEILDPLVI